MDISLFRSVASQYRDLRHINTVPMMNVISRQIEDQIIRHQLTVDFYAGFQRFSNFPDQLRRYSRLGSICRRVYVFGIADYQPPAIPGIEFIELTPTSALANEWFLLVDTPDYWATLVAQEIDGKDSLTGGRRYDGLWSFDEQIVDRISLLMSQIMETAYQPVRYRNYSKQNAHVAEISSSMLNYLEQSEASGQRRWVQLRALQQIAGFRAKNVLELLQSGAKILHTIFGATAVAIAVRTSGDQYTIAAIEGDATGRGVKLPLKKGWLGQVIQQGRPVQFLAVNRKQETEPVMPTARALIAAPLISSRVHGAVAVGNTEPNRWTEEDGQTIVAIAKILAVQLEQLLTITKGKNSSSFPISGIRT